MIKAKYLILIFTGILAWSCNQNEQIAAYVTIEPFEFTPGDDHIQSSKITDGWIYVDNEFLGAFELPKTIPVLKSGENSIVVDPGIKENGISATPDIYTFYKRYSTTATLVPGETVTVLPASTYDEDKTNRLFEEYFEEGTHQFNADLDGNENTNVDFTTADVKEGIKSGRIYLDTENDAIIVGSTFIFNPPSTGLTAYIELDYKNEVPLLVGLAGYTGSGQLIYSEVNLGVNPKSDWNKIYFNVTEKLRDLAIAGSSQYRIVFRAQIPRENGEFTMENAEIYLDNVKLVSL